MLDERTTMKNINNYN